MLLLGCFATQSRTAIVMLVVVALVFLRLRPRATRRLWPLLLPLLLAIHLALPGALGSLKDAFLPQGGLIAQQESGKGTHGSGRIADLGPSLSEYGQRPLLGEGFATRVTDKGPYAEREHPRRSMALRPIGDWDRRGACTVLWAFIRSFRRLSRQARDDPTPRGWLCVALAASLLSFAVGMLTFDAFSFTQVTFVFFILLGLGSALVDERLRRRRLLWQDGSRPSLSITTVGA